MDVNSFEKDATSKYSFVSFYMLFQWVFRTIWVLVVGSFKDIFMTRIKNMILTSKNGAIQSKCSEFVDMYIQQQKV